ncbi:hypothetical protein EXU57_24730 [Segetibacter sp. 3557_3]|uniref:hypothetical protein n=1 Tax=Segetibacter sp. 3557_3 TaxID=2547429 RepID=UPI0010589B97|nr:hypothetical protein [Segetibacter sp. 3557_3]TDH17799.1 hypothetical protein EXU57_24730 [Segetibacter sp. 3557_3]
MKSRQLRDFYKETSDLNNAFTHYFFVWTQFTLDYTDDIAESPDDLTETYFEGNHYAPKHRVRLKELSNEHAKTNETLLQGIFILILSHFEDYLKSIHEFSQKIDDTIKHLEQGEFEDDSLVIDKTLNRIGVDKASIAPEYFDTYDFLRLKRNRLVHKGSEKISKSIRDFIGKKGKGLNTFWKETLPKGLQGIDFTSKEEMDKIEFNTLIDTLNTLRGTSAKIDEAIIKKLGVVEISKKEVLPKFIEDTKTKLKRLSEKKVQSMFAGYCRTEYGFTPNENIVKQIVDDIA